MSELEVVVGGLYGSEAKGHVTQRLVERHQQDGHTVLNIRVGGPNAGHTGHDAKGTPWALRQVPIGVVTEGLCDLQIAAGSEIDLPVLLDEISRLTAAGLMAGKRLVVHPEATLINDRHKETETALVGRIGSTGKGIGAARADRLMRSAQRLMDSPHAIRQLESAGAIVSHDDFSVGNDATVIEGTQGYALGLHAGYYPECTSGDCRAIDFMAQAGINPWRFDNLAVWVVARVFPIRVAGNSGPLLNETSWQSLGLPEERTTVTKKVRRVGKPDWALVRQAVEANGPRRVQVALSMVDQAFPEVAGVPWDENDPEWADAEETLRKIEVEIAAPIGLVMSGPNTAAFRYGG